MAHLDDNLFAHIDLHVYRCSAPYHGLYGCNDSACPGPYGYADSPLPCCDAYLHLSADTHLYRYIHRLSPHIDPYQYSEIALLFADR